MTVNFALTVYLPTFAALSRPVTITPIASQPGAPPYPARGIFDAERITFETLEGAIFSETRTILPKLIGESAT